MPEDSPQEPKPLSPLTLSRRDWFKLVGSGVVIGLGAHAAGNYDKLIPLLVPEEQIVPGIATWYATACRECPAGCGMLVRNREGRVVKCEGNPDHPINRGRLCARGQAALQGLYDPDRLRQPLRRTEAGLQPATWAEALAAVGARLREGRGRVAVISDLQTGSLGELIRRGLGALGSERYLVYEPVSYAGMREAHRRLWGEAVLPIPHLERADFLLSLSADFLDTWLSPVQFTRDFTDLRRVGGGQRVPFVYAGPRLSLTAAAADERVLLRPGAEPVLALALLRTLAEEGLARRPEVAAVAGPEWAPEAVEAYAGLPAGRIRELALRLAGARAPLILGGGGVSIAPAETETALAAALLNLALETPALDLGTRHAGEEAALPEETAAFIRELAAGEVETLLILGANPAYSLPPESGFQYALERVPTVVALSPYRDETAELAHWVLPVSTPLESWGDYEPQTGVANLQQPVMGSLYETPMPGDALLELLRAAGVDPEAALGAGSFYDFLRKRWQEQWLGTDYFEEAWSAAVQRGWREDLVPSMPAPAPRLRPAPSFTRPAPDNEMRLWLHPSLSHFDGRGANRRWLQELPDPVTQMAWDSWLEIHPDEAARLGLRTGDLLQMASAGTPLTVPAYVHPGVALGTVALALGQGHTAYGRYAQGTGVNAAVLLGGEAQTGSFGTVNLTPAGAGGKPRRVESATSQEGRAIVRTVALAELEGLRREPLVMPLPEGYTPDRDMYPPHSYAEHRWAMTVDLSRCVGCGACVTACYAENNVGVVGPREIGNNRVMSWIRVDRYADWREAGAPVLFQPMLCQHCDAAPCEPVCPVFASAHNEEGLNMQVYNRCVGTRYCSNNCPYKVRRFNWFDYEWPEPLNWQANPEVTVRRRGVMEKCSFCIQRIREAEFAAEEAGRPLRDGEIVPACAQTCPAGVFTFGDLMDPASRVSQIVHGEPRAYQALDELNTKPAVFYLKRVVEARA